MSLSANSSVPIDIFLSYASPDKAFRKKLETHMSILQRNGVRLWFDDYAASDNRYQSEAGEHLQSAHIILLLLSANFMASDQCLREMELSLERQKNGSVEVIPVLLRPIGALEVTPLSEFTPLPSNHRPVSRWINKDEAYVDIVKGVQKVIQKIRSPLRRKQWAFKMIKQPQPLHPILRAHTIRELYARLVAPDTTAIALTGINGAGLSTLADLLYHYAEEQRSGGNGPFTANVLKISIEHATTMVELVEIIFDALGESLPDDTSHSPQNLVALLFRKLNETKSPRLLILDQFEFLLEIEKGIEASAVIKEWLHLLNNRPSRSRVLLVSHLKLCEGEQERFLHEFRSDGLETEEAIELLRSSNVDAPPADLRVIVERLGGHAMALTLLAQLLRGQKHIPAVHLREQTFQTLPETIAGYIERYQLDVQQRVLLFAFAIYREPVPLDAALALLDENITQSAALSALKNLQALYLLREDANYYWLPSLIANYAYNRSTAMLTASDRQTELLRAHEKAALYYEQLLRPSPHKMLEITASIHKEVEAAWHLCQARQWQRAYTLLAQENIFKYLLRRGRSVVLLDLCHQLLPAKKWHAQPQQEADLLKEVGKAYDRLGRKREAQHYLEQALPLFREVGDRQNEASTLTHLGEVYKALEQKEQALVCYQQALSICREAQDVDEYIQAVVLNDLGEFYRELDEDEQALKYFEQALPLHGDTSEEATTLNNLAGLYESMGKMEDAYRYYQKALRFFREIGDRRGEGSVLHNLGRHQRRQEKFKAAQEYYESAWRIFREIGDVLSESVTLRNLCQLHLLQEQYRSSLACIFLAKKILVEMQNPQQDDLQGIITLISHQFGKERFTEMWGYFEKNGSVVVDSIMNDAENS